MLERLQKSWLKLRSVFDAEFDRSSLEFLPAALEVMETPPAPLGRAVLWAIVSFFVIALLWATFGEVDIVAVAQGKIVPSGRVKVIQPLETGVVKVIYVEDGQKVEEGQPLIELDSTVSGADKDRLESELLTLKLDLIRYNRLLKKLEEQNISIKVLENEENQKLDFDVNEELRNRSRQQFEASLNEYNARKSALQSSLEEHQAEQKSTEERIVQLEETIPLISERAAAIKKMLASGVVSRADWLKVEEDRINQVKQLDIQKSELNRLKAAVGGAEQQLNALSSQVQGQWLSELSETENRIGAIEQELVKAKQRQTLQMLTAPVTGTVQQLAIHTVGGVVTPAQQLMLVVPDEKAIEVEAWIQNRDIGFVEAGQVAEIKIETFAYTKYGVINGEIQSVSNDAVPNEQLGLVYIARVLMEKTTMLVNGKTVNLSPGMAVTVEVKTGKRRVIEYLMSPLLRYKEESIQER